LAKFFSPQKHFFFKVEVFGKVFRRRKVFLSRRRISFGEEEKNSLSSKSIFLKSTFEKITIERL